MITLRLDPKLEQAVNSAAKNLGLTKSELIRQCISSYIGDIKQPNVWKTGEDLFGKYASGVSNLSANRKGIIKKKSGQRENEKILIDSGLLIALFDASDKFHKKQ